MSSASSSVCSAIQTQCHLIDSHNDDEHSSVATPLNHFNTSVSSPDSGVIKFNTEDSIISKRRYTLVAIEDKDKVEFIKEKENNKLKKIDIESVTKPIATCIPKSAIVPIISSWISNPIDGEILNQIVADARLGGGFGDTMLIVQTILQHFGKAELSVFDICFIQYLLTPDESEQNIGNLLSHLTRFLALERGGDIQNKASLMCKLFSKYSMDNILQQLKNMPKKAESCALFASELLSSCEEAILTMSRKENSNYFAAEQAKHMVEHDMPLMMKRLTTEQREELEKDKENKVNVLAARSASAMVLISSILWIRTHCNWELTNSFRKKTDYFDYTFDEDKTSLRGNVNSLFCLIPLCEVEAEKPTEREYASDHPGYRFDDQRSIISDSNKRFINLAIELQNHCSTMKGEGWSDLDNVDVDKDDGQFVVGLGCDFCKSMYVAVNYRTRAIFINSDIGHFFNVHFKGSNVDFCNGCFDKNHAIWKAKAFDYIEAQKVAEAERIAKLEESGNSIDIHKEPGWGHEPFWIPRSNFSGEDVRGVEGTCNESQSHLQQGHDTEAGSIQNE